MDVTPIKLDLDNINDEPEVDHAEEAVRQAKKKKTQLLSIIAAICCTPLLGVGLLFATGSLPEFMAPSLESSTDKKNAADGESAESQKGEGNGDGEKEERDGGDLKNEKNKKKKPGKENAAGFLEHSKKTSYFAMKPIAVKVTSETGKAHLMVAIALEADMESATALFKMGEEVKDEAVSVIRKIDPNALKDMNGSVILKGRLRKKLSELYPDYTIRAIIVQDYTVF